MKTSNKVLALEWTLACTGLKLCPPFNTRSSEGTIGTLDTALNRSRRSTIHCYKKGALCWRSHLKENWQASFYDSAWQAASFQSPTLETALSEDNSWTKGATEFQYSQKDMDTISLGLAISMDTTLNHLFALRRSVAHETQPNLVRKGGLVQQQSFAGKSKHGIGFRVNHTRLTANRSDQRNNVEESAFTMVTLLFIFGQRDGDS